ncbi:MAG: hypothetical protein AB7O52_05225 [Planctomycetota bacterium]
MAAPIVCTLLASSRLLLRATLLVMATLGSWYATPALTPLALAQSKKGAVKGDYLGKPLPRLTVDKWHNGPSLPPSLLSDIPWVLVMMSVDAPVFESVAPLLESVHKDRDQGGPVVIVFSKEENKVIEKALRRRETKPRFSIANDRLVDTYRLLDPPSLPYVYLVGADGNVTDQGNLNGDIQQKMRALRGAPPKAKAGNPPAGEVVGPTKLSADFEDRLRKALDRPKPQPLIKLLREVYEGDAKPTHARLAKLWDEVDGLLDVDLEKVTALATKQRFSEARDQMEKVQDRFAGFPPVTTRIAGVHADLAKAQGEPWLRQAREARAMGDVDGARVLLTKILEHYGDTAVGKAAKELLAELDGATPH